MSILQFQPGLWVVHAVLALVTTLAGISLHAAPRPRFQLTDLGALPGASSGGIARDINSHGHIVGYAVGSNFAIRPFIYRHGVMNDTGAGNTYGEAVAISDAGHVITHEFIGDGPHSFLIHQGSAIDLSAQAGHFVSAARVNRAGAVVGVMSPRSGQYLAFHWSQGVFTPLGNLPGGSTSSALAINNHGRITGAATLPAEPVRLGNYRAVFFVGGEVSILGLPPGAIGNIGTAINDHGQVAGDAYQLEGQTHAFLFDQRTLRDLGTLQKDSMSNAMGINKGSQVVGISQNGVTEPRAFLYSDGVMYDLNALVNHAAGWHFRTANAINDKGQIVGEALVNGGSRPYLLTPE